MTADNRTHRDVQAEKVVAVARSHHARYGPLDRPAIAPELTGRQVTTIAQQAVRDLFREWGLDAARADTASWNPLGEFVPVGAKVVLKPNLVAHQNRSGRGLDCLVTHTEFIAAVLDYLLLAKPGAVILGDAPIQGCDFAELRRALHLDDLIAKYRSLGLDLTLVDFRRTILAGENPGATRFEECRDLRQFVLFDLARQSLLESLSNDSKRFRVTMYDPRLMQRTHAAGRHQYLVARELIDAAVVFNLPKLKTHKKAGITGALKNLVGINGHKEYLPHHRKGGAAQGGDCYPGRSLLKSITENCLDAANMSQGGARQKLFFNGARVTLALARAFGEDDNLEGSWYGNDTVWRMALDLQRVVRFGRLDGTLSDSPQRRVVTLTDAIVAGEGDGPLSPIPVPAGFITGSTNPASAEWAHALLMGFDPARIPLVREAFGQFAMPLAEFGPESVRVRESGVERSCSDLEPALGRPFLPPHGWRGHCERP